MGHILSSETIYAAAFLTEIGRQYLFDPMANKRFDLDTDIDAFKIVYFSMSDPDYNYNVTSGIQFETGDIANISGKNEDCIKGTIMKNENNLISVDGVIRIGKTAVATQPPSIDEPYVLATNSPINTIQVNLNSMPVTPGV